MVNTLAYLPAKTLQNVPSGSAQRTIYSKKPFLKNEELGKFPENLIIRIDPKVKFIGRFYGDEPTKATVHELGDALYKQWSERDGGPTSKDYDKRLDSRFASFHTPAIVAYHKEWPSAVLLPVQAEKIPETSSEIADERFWDADIPSGKKLVVRKLVSVHGGLAEKLVDAYLQYANELFKHGLIDAVVAFTRPKNFKAWHEEHPELAMLGKEELVQHYLTTTEAKNVLLHLGKGAVIGRTYLDGCPKDSLAEGIMFEMDYTHLLCSR